MSLLNNKDNKKIVENMNYEDYDVSPIDSFGLNMLKKMGWQENQNINGKKQIKPFELKPRHYRLGLGATPLDPTKEQIKYSDSDKNLKEKSKNYFGAKLKIIHGKHKGLKAIIVEKIICEDLNDYFKKNTFVKVELKINKEVLTIETKNLKIRKGKNNEKSKNKKQKKKKNKKNYKKYRKYSYDISSSSNESKIEKNNNVKDPNDSENLYNKDEVIKYINKKSSRKNKEIEEKYKDSNINIYELDNPEEILKKNYTEKKKGERINDILEKKLNWVMLNIIVRIINKKHKYYNKKATVIDFPSSDQFTLIAFDGNVIDNLNEEDIETVIPDIGEKVMVLKGNDKGEFGELMQIDFNIGVITIQMLNDFSIKIFKVDECSAIGNSL